MSKWERHPAADDIGMYVQSVGGYCEVSKHKVEFYVPVEYRDFMMLKYPFLEPVDYIL